MGDSEERQRNADWLALQRVFIGAQGASWRDDAKLQRAEKLAAIGSLATFPAGFYVSGFEGAEDRRGWFVTVAVTDEDFVFLDGEVEPDPMRELGRIPRAGARVEIRPAGLDATVTPRGFTVECELSLRSGEDETEVVLAFGSEEGAREVESRLRNRTPPPGRAIEPGAPPFLGVTHRTEESAAAEPRFPRPGDSQAERRR